ncbi:hypothetical protein LCGC14_2986750, partial [marine sediment metagenome]
DQATWEYNDGTDDIGANWALIVLRYLIGWQINSKLVIGMGIDPDDIDMDQAMAAANVCEETVDAKSRFKIGGIFETNNDHPYVIRQLEAAIGGSVAKIGGKYFIWAPNDDLSAAFSSIGEGEFIAEAGVEFSPAGQIEDLFNTVRGRYVEPDELYQPISYNEVVESSAVTEDGKTRMMDQDFSIIQDFSIAQRIGRYLVRRSRFSGTWKFAMGPSGLRFRPFDVTTLNCIETNNSNETVRIIDMEYGVSGVVLFEVIEEDSSIYDTSDALGSSVIQNDPGVLDPTTTVAVAGLNVAAATFTGGGNTVIDALNITWTDPGGLVAETEIRYRKNGSGDPYEYVPASHISLQQAIVTGINTGTTYEVGAR